MIKETPRECNQKQDQHRPEGKVRYLPAEKKPSFGEKLVRNVALAAMIALTVTAVRTAELPSGKTVSAAIREMIEPDWGERLGKISFVSRLFPETISVFLDSGAQIALTAPCMAPVTHVWSKDEPYLAYPASGMPVYAAAAGQVMSVAHGEGEERILRLRHEDGMETMYYNLKDVLVREGDPVTKETMLGNTLPGSDMVFEVRRAGRAIDPTNLISSRSQGL